MLEAPWRRDGGLDERRKVGREEEACVLELGWVFGQVWYCDEGWWGEAKAVDKDDGREAVLRREGRLKEGV
jgi:hypothetical protein